MQYRLRQSILLERNGTIELVFYEEAVQALERANQLAPNLAYIYVDEGIALYKLGRYDEVVSICRQAIKLDANCARAYHGQALALAELGQYTAAYGNCIQAIQLNPQNPKLYITKAELLIKFKCYKQARETYVGAVKLDSFAQVRNLFDEGPNFLSNEQRQEAHKLLEGAILLGLNQVKAYGIYSSFFFDKGKEFFKHEHNNMALEAYEEAIKFQKLMLTSDNITTSISLADTLIAKGEVLFQLKRYQEIIRLYKEVRKIYREDKQVYEAKSIALMEKARLLYLQSDYAASYAAYTRSILFDPNDLYKADYRNKSKDLLITTLKLYEEGRYEEAIVSYRKAVQFDPYSEIVKVATNDDIDNLKFLRQLIEPQTPQMRDFHTPDTLDALDDKREQDIKPVIMSGKRHQINTEEIAWFELMTEGKDGIRKASILYIAGIEEVADPDDYDPYHNQYYDPDDIYE